MTTKYYCSKHSLNLTGGTVTRAYGSHKCYCGKSAKFQVKGDDKIRGAKVTKALMDELPPLDYPKSEGMTNATSTPEPNMGEWIDEEWKYRHKDKANAFKAMFYMIAFGGACWCVYELATMST